MLTEMVTLRKLKHLLGRVINTEFRGNTDLVDASPLKHFHWVAYNGDAATFYGCSSLKDFNSGG